MRAWLFLSFLFLGCVPHAPPRPNLGALEEESELWVYLAPVPAEAQRVTLTIDAVSAISAHGVEVPLALDLPRLFPGGPQALRLLAHGRLPPGSYLGVSVHFAQATVGGGDALLVPEEPVRIEVAMTLPKGQAAMLQATLQRAWDPQHQVTFSPAFSAALIAPAHTLSQLDGYCTNEGGASLTVFDKHRHEVVATLSTGREPQGLALDGMGRRLMVALGGQDQVQVIDLATGEELRRVSLEPGDRPGALALAPDGRTLMVANVGTSTVAFVDPIAGVLLDRVRVGDEPVALLLDRAGRRAVVVNRQSNSLTVLDVASRQVVATVQTEAQPTRAQLNRAGTRLYVIQAGSQQLAVYSMPGLELVNRINVGLGAAALKVDPRTDLLYVALADEARVRVYDPLSLTPLEWFDTPGPVNYLTIDDVENALVALVPSEHVIVFTHLTSKQPLGQVDVGDRPFHLLVEGERN